MNTTIDYEKIAKKIRKTVLKMKFDAQTSHIGSAFSCVDILVVLYYRILSINPKNPLMNNRDRFILSKGHAASALYAVLAEKQFFDKKILNNYCTNNGKLLGHSTRNYARGIEVSTGS